MADDDKEDEKHAKTNWRKERRTRRKRRGGGGGGGGDGGVIDEMKEDDRVKITGILHQANGRLNGQSCSSGVPEERGTMVVPRIAIGTHSQTQAHIL